MNTPVIIAAIIVYISGMIYVGFRSNRRNSDIAFFYLGGRSLGPLVTAMSAEASDMSGWLLMGLPGLALMTGLAEAVWTAIGLAIGTYVNWLIVARRLRIYTEKLSAVTLPEYFSKRFGDKRHVVSLIAALIIVIFFIPYTASGFAACGKLFSSLFGMDYLKAMLLSALVITCYCVLGGFLAASTTDLIQSIVMSIALVLVLGIAEGITGGFGNIFASVRSMDGYLDIMRGFDVASSTPSSYGPLTIASTMAWGLGYFGMPHILLRFMAIRDPGALKLSRRVATVWVVISMGAAILIGVAGYGLVSAGILAPYVSASAAETIIVDISRFLASRGWIPAFAAGVFLSGILASTMSTADSQLIAASSSITQDLLVDFFGIKMTEVKKLMLARISVAIIAVIAVFFAIDPTSSVFRIVSFAWAGFGAAFGPLVLFSLFYRKTNRAGAVAGIISGGAMVFIWKFGIAKLGGLFAIYELLPAFIFSAIMILVVSNLTGGADRSVTDTFDRVSKMM
ncbi:MAG: sodium/proline symporter [Eubacteriaceae bacterium]|nr:sodium/proline symporter [Eubacteriaceae bacterium]